MKIKNHDSLGSLIEYLHYTGDWVSVVRLRQSYEMVLAKNLSYGFKRFVVTVYSNSAGIIHKWELKPPRKHISRSVIIEECLLSRCLRVREILELNGFLASEGEWTKAEIEQIQEMSI